MHFIYQWTKVLMVKVCTSDGDTLFSQPSLSQAFLSTLVRRSSYYLTMPHPLLVLLKRSECIHIHISSSQAISCQTSFYQASSSFARCAPLEGRVSESHTMSTQTSLSSYYPSQDMFDIQVQKVYIPFLFILLIFWSDEKIFYVWVLQDVGDDSSPQIPICFYYFHPLFCYIFSQGCSQG